MPAPRMPSPGDSRHPARYTTLRASAYSHSGGLCEQGWTSEVDLAAEGLRWAGQGAML
jgi:hypothetical protein